MVGNKHIITEIERFNFPAETLRDKEEIKRIALRRTELIERLENLASHPVLAEMRAMCAVKESPSQCYHRWAINQLPRDKRVEGGKVLSEMNKILFGIYSRQFDRRAIGREDLRRYFSFVLQNEIFCIGVEGTDRLRNGRLMFDILSVNPVVNFK